MPVPPNSPTVKTIKYMMVKSIVSIMSAKSSWSGLSWLCGDASGHYHYGRGSVCIAPRCFLASGKACPARSTRSSQNRERGSRDWRLCQYIEYPERKVSRNARTDAQMHTMMQEHSKDKSTTSWMLNSATSCQKWRTCLRQHRPDECRNFCLLTRACSSVWRVANRHDAITSSSLFRLKPFNVVIATQPTFTQNTQPMQRQARLSFAPGPWRRSLKSMTVRVLRSYPSSAASRAHQISQPLT